MIKVVNPEAQATKVVNPETKTDHPRAKLIWSNIFKIKNQTLKKYKRYDQSESQANDKSSSD